jgi:hypothetical protein
LPCASVISAVTASPYLRISKEEPETYIPNKFAAFPEHYNALANLLRAYGEQVGREKLWAENILAAWAVAIDEDGDEREDMGDFYVKKALRYWSSEIKSAPFTLDGKTGMLYRAWTEQEQQRLLKLVDLHPVNEIARLLRRSQSSIWHMLQRLGGSAKMGKDSFTIYTLAVALHVRPEKIKEWIAREWLKSRQIETGKAVRTVIEMRKNSVIFVRNTRERWWGTVSPKNGWILFITLYFRPAMPIFYQFVRVRRSVVPMKCN